jgi:hypothetical protein
MFKSIRRPLGSTSPHNSNHGSILDGRMFKSIRRPPGSTSLSLFARKLNTPSGSRSAHWETRLLSPPGKALA